MLKSAVEPVWERRIGNPRMALTNVVGNNVEQHFHFFLLSGGDELLIVRERAQMGINRVEVCCAITVIILRGIVFHDGREPKSCYAELFEIRQAIEDAAQISAMPGAWIGAVVRSGGAGGVGRFVVAGIAVGETIGHDEITYVFGGNSLESAKRWGARCDGKLEWGRAD